MKAYTCTIIYLVILGLCNGTDIEIPLELRDEMTAEMVQGKYTVNSKILRGFYFCETSHMRSFAKIKPSRNSENSLSFTDVGKSSQSREFLVLQICLLTLFAKIKFSGTFPNLQYIRNFILCQLYSQSVLIPGIRVLL